jgi:DhnA family fructose-bisphosphate aldolase class Ia
VDDAIRIGADAVAVSAFPGAPEEEDSLRSLAMIIGEAHAWGLPVMGEMVPGGFDSPDHMRSAESIAIAARVGAEIGADWVKIPYAPGFKAVTSTCYVPAVILGGAKKGSERDMLEKIRAALDVGAKGVAIGRNIFQADNPQAMVAAIAALIHENVSIDEAMKILNSK